MGWAKEHLVQGQRAAIAATLFEVREESNGWLNGRCPLHDDANPSFGYHPAEDVYHCHAACSPDGDLIDLFRMVGGYGRVEGFKKFKAEYGDGADLPASSPPRRSTSSKEESDPDYSQLAEAYKKFPTLPVAWVSRLSELRGWKKETIHGLGIRLQTHYRDKTTGKLKELSAGFERIALPVYDKDDQLVNIRLYKPDAKENKIISWGKGFGANRLFPSPTIENEELIWLCEGEADTICAMSHGLCAVTQTAKRKVWPDDEVETFRGRDVVIAYDADGPGREYARAAASSLTEVAASVRILNWPSYMMNDDGSLPKKDGQDLTDFFIRHKKSVADLHDLLSSAEDVEASEGGTKAEKYFQYGLSGRLSFRPHLLAKQLMRDVDPCYDGETSTLFRWNGRYYEKIKENVLKELAIRYLGDEAEQKRYNDAVNQAIMLSSTPVGRTMNDQPNLLCLKNGMFNTDTYEIIPHHKDYLASIHIDLDYDPEKPADCPRWRQFLEETIQTPEVIEQLQEFFGLCLTRERRYEKVLIMVGDGGDGKSTSQEVLTQMVGERNCSAIGFEDLTKEFSRVSLHNKLVNLSSEVSGKALDAEYLKKIISGDRTSGSYKFKDIFEFKPYCKLVFAVNKMPKVLDTTDGLYRKILPIRYKRQFLAGDKDKDPYLIEKLLAELPGIFGWAVVGLDRLRTRGEFNMDVAETKELIHGYRKQNNPTYAFVEDCLELTEDNVDLIDKKELYKKYRSYCAKNGYGASSNANFFIDLRLAVKAYREYRPRRDGARPTMVVGLRFKEGTEYLDSTDY